jgi:hypothetical protein
MANVDENWRVLSSLMPRGWRELAWQSGAWRRIRGFESADQLLRTLLLHVARGYSLRETAAQAKLAGLADISDVALLKRLRAAEEWFRQLCLTILAEDQVTLPRAAEGRVLRLVDATVVNEPGKTGSLWRLHYSLRLPALMCDFFRLTPVTGEGSGETFARIPIERGDCILGDAGYCCGAGIGHVVAGRGDLIVRLNPSAVRLKLRGKAWDLLKALSALQEAGETRDWRVKVETPNGDIAVRVCAIRKSQEQIERAHGRLKRKASKKGHDTRPETLEYVKFVLVLTTLTAGTAGRVLEWYRIRWQVELAFKRLKSLVQLGHLPKYDDASSRAWLYGKLFVALLGQRLMKVGRDISPWGYPMPDQAERVA